MLYSPEQKDALTRHYKMPRQMQVKKSYYQHLDVTSATEIFAINRIKWNRKLFWYILHGKGLNSHWREIPEEFC